MKFRPRLETLDRRDLPDASPVTAPEPVYTLTLPGQSSPTTVTLTQVAEYVSTYTDVELAPPNIIQQIKDLLAEIDALRTKLGEKADLLEAEIKMLDDASEEMLTIKAKLLTEPPDPARDKLLADLAAEQKKYDDAKAAADKLVDEMKGIVGKIREKEQKLRDILRPLIPLTYSQEDPVPVQE